MAADWKGKLQMTRSIQEHGQWCKDHCLYEENVAAIEVVMAADRAQALTERARKQFVKGGGR